MSKRDQPIAASGLVLPCDAPLPVQEVIRGLYVVQRSHERELGFFSESPLFAKDPEPAAGARSGEADSDSTRIGGPFPLPD